MRYYLQVLPILFWLLVTLVFILSLSIFLKHDKQIEYLNYQNREVNYGNR